MSQMFTEKVFDNYKVYEYELAVFEFYLKIHRETKEMKLDETLAWEHINILVTKNFLKREYEKAMNEEVTSNCRQNCAGCGAAVAGCGVCFERSEAHEG